MKAMILAAGLGTRLAPFTHDRPKALVPVAGRPMIEWLLLHLKRQGITEIVVNVHHFAGQVRDFLRANGNFGLHIQLSDESGRLFDTGGGVWNASGLLKGDGPILVQNVDVMAGVDYGGLIKQHLDTAALVTLAVSQRDSSRMLFFDDKNQLCAWQNINTGQRRQASQATGELRGMAFSGISVLDPRVFDWYTRSGAFSIIDAFLAIAASHPVIAWQHEAAMWIDMGKPEHLAEAALLLESLPNYI